MRILFTGGGSGGHVVPIIAVSREIRKLYISDIEPNLKNKKKGLEFYYIGPRDDFGSILLSQEGITVKTVLAGKVRRYGGIKNIFKNILDVVFKIPLGTLQSLFLVFFISPDLVFSKGGFGSIPAVLAGKMLFAPVFLHESDVAPGMANRFISRFALKIFVSFPKTEYFPQKKMILTGSPVRKEILDAPRAQARESLKISGEKPVILILGGSQGAQRINDKILEILPQLLEKFEIIHQCGEKNYQSVRAEAKVATNTPPAAQVIPGYHLFPFMKESDLRDAYAASDLIISRAGAGSIFEIASAGKPSILVPLPESAQDHQMKNAYSFQDTGGCLVLEEANFTAHFFLEKLKYLFSTPELLSQMARSARDFSKPEAGKAIARYILDWLVKK